MPDDEPIFDDFFIPADEDHVKREKAKARDLRKSQWWKNQLGRGQCHYCQQRVPPKELTMDHVVPIVRGGRTTHGNVVPCCKDCNNKKKYMLPVEWQEHLQRLADQSRGDG
jgi:5-methylcytosine-specific restriction endonuclease McrA